MKLSQRSEQRTYNKAILTGLRHAPCWHMTNILLFYVLLWVILEIHEVTKSFLSKAPACPGQFVHLVQRDASDTEINYIPEHYASTSSRSLSQLIHSAGSCYIPFTLIYHAYAFSVILKCVLMYYTSTTLPSRSQFSLYYSDMILCDWQDDKIQILANWLIRVAFRVYFSSIHFIANLFQYTSEKCPS